MPLEPGILKMSQPPRSPENASCLQGARKCHTPIFPTKTPRSENAKEKRVNKSLSYHRVPPPLFVLQVDQVDL
jgi:hypothetical protein